jgi:hypothetical protein
MKTQLIPLVGDAHENLYQLGKKERESFNQLELRVQDLLSTNKILRYGQDLISRTQMILKKKERTFFHHAIASYAEGLGIKEGEYLSFLSHFELAAHYGQIFPELKGLLPGCTSVFEKTPEGIAHHRLIDFPLIGLFESTPRLYYFNFKDRGPILNYSCEGLPLCFLQTLHHSGFTLALHHRPAPNYQVEGESIFSILFNGLFDTPDMEGFRREVRKKISQTKWGLHMMNSQGRVVCLDLDGPSSQQEIFDLNESSPLIFTNRPLKNSAPGFESYLQFCEHRERWIQHKLKSSKSSSQHPLDLLCEVKESKPHPWSHPTATLSTTGALSINLTKGVIHLKEGEGPLVAGDAIVEFSLDKQDSGKILRQKKDLTSFERAWKHAGTAQSSYDQGQFDMAYHHLQMAQALVPDPVWKNIFQLYLNIWDFRFISNKNELAQVYQQTKSLTLPPILKDQWALLCMRLEKRLGLVLTLTSKDVSVACASTFQQEVEAPKAIFNIWMKFVYPRLEILDVFSPHRR